MGVFPAFHTPLLSLTYLEHEARHEWLIPNAN